MLIFYPELFEAQAKAQEALADAGIDWFADYSSCSPMHEEFGLMIEGFHSKQRARMAMEIVRRTFPKWRFSCVWYNDEFNAKWCISHCSRRYVCG